MRAVTTDNAMRIWVADDSLTTGLLFRCNLGRILLDAPVGEASAPSAPVCPLFLYPRQQVLEPGRSRRGVQRAGLLQLTGMGGVQQSGRGGLFQQLGWTCRAAAEDGDGGRGAVWTGDEGRLNVVIGDTSAGLLQKMGMEGAEQVRMEATLAAAQDPFEMRFVAQLRERAVDSWQVRGSSCLSYIAPL